ncbi:MAG: hypothetical protein IJ027_04645 [Oscillospiraceae bacterium]|nr:hypothetical protein [Oscillospiraceae bacterium]
MTKRIFTLLLLLCVLVFTTACDKNSSELSYGESDDILTEAQVRKIIKEEIQLNENSKEQETESQTSQVEKEESENEQIQSQINKPNTDTESKNALTEADIRKIIKEEISSKAETKDVLTEADIRKIIKEEISSKAETKDVLTEAQIRKIVNEELSSQEVKFVPGKELICPQGKSFKMYGQFYHHSVGTSSGSVTRKETRENFVVEITSFKAKMLKEADINNPEDYCLKRTYFPYLYQVEVKGKIDPKYAKHTTTLDIRFPQDGSLTFYDNDNIGNIITVNDDGSFSFTTRLGYCSIQDTIMITQIYSY